MKKSIISIFALSILFIAGQSMAASSWKAVADGNLTAAATWQLESGTPAVGQVYPVAGDTITVTGHNVFMDGNTTFASVTIGSGGKIIGSSYDLPAPLAVVHNWDLLTIEDGGNLTLAEGRKAGTVTYNLGNMTGSGNSSMTCAYFAASTAADQTVPTIDFQGNVNWVSTATFPIYPLNFGGTLYDMAKLIFSGTDATVVLPKNGNIDCNSVIVQAGAKVTLDTKSFNVSKNLVSGEYGDFEIYGTALFKSPTFVWCYGGDGGIVVKDGGIIGTDFSGGFSTSGTPGSGTVIGSTITFEAGSGVEFFGSETQVVGDQLPASVGTFVLNKTAGTVVSLASNLTVQTLYLTEGTLDTGSYTLTGPNSGQLYQTNGIVTGNWIPLACVCVWVECN